MEITLIIPELNEKTNALMNDETNAVMLVLKNRIAGYKNQIISTNNFIAEANATIAEYKNKIVDRESAVENALKLREETFEKINAATALLNSLEKITG